MKPSYDPTKPWSRRRREFGASAQNGAYNEGYDKTAPTGLLRGRMGVWAWPRDAGVVTVW